jgi:hypothetical protein
LAFAKAISSFTLFTGALMLATRRFGVTPASVIGAKSLVTSNEVLYRLWMTEKGSAAPYSV